jgi:hypothetical protein
MDAFERDDGGQAGLGGARSLFLSLYLVLLAFFIALISLSSFEESRTRAVVDSLWSTFAGPRGTPRDMVPPSRSGSLLGAARQFVVEAGELFASAIPAAKTRELSGGSVLEVTLSADILFPGQGDQPRSARTDLVDRLVAALSASPAGIRRFLEIAVATGGASNAPMPEEGSLERRRAAALGAWFLTRGAPSDSLAVGLAPGPLGVVVLSFRVMPEGEGDDGEDWRTRPPVDGPEGER